MFNIQYSHRIQSLKSKGRFPFYKTFNSFIVLFLHPITVCGSSGLQWSDSHRTWSRRCARNTFISRIVFFFSIFSDCTRHKYVTFIISLWHLRKHYFRIHKEAMWHQCAVIFRELFQNNIPGSATQSLFSKLNKWSKIHVNFINNFW